MNQYGAPRSCTDCRMLQDLDGKPSGSCWFGLCPYKLAEREPMLPAAARMAQEIAVERDEEEPFGSKDARFRGPRTKRWVPSGDALQFVCWFYGLTKMRERQRLLEWAGIVCRALNDVRRGSDYFLSGNADEMREPSLESAPRVTRSIRRDDATGRLVSVIDE